MRNAHVQYKALALTVQKYIARLVFKKWVKLQGQGHKVKNYGTHGKVLSQGNSCEISKL